MSNIVECKKLTKQYSGKTALQEVDLVLESGRIIGLLGPNGSGKTTLLKLINKLLVPTSGEILVDGQTPGTETKAVVSYLPERSYLGDWMYVQDALDFFRDFYADFDTSRALNMLEKLQIGTKDKIKAMSKGTKEKLQLILVMSRRAKLYCLDEPIAGVDPAARDYILSTIINNYDEQATILISTHLIADVENILDDVIFIQNGKVRLHQDVEEIRTVKGTSVDHLFREVFKC